MKEEMKRVIETKRAREKERREGNEKAREKEEEKEANRRYFVFARRHVRCERL